MSLSFYSLLLVMLRILVFIFLSLGLTPVCLYSQTKPTVLNLAIPKSYEIFKAQNAINVDGNADDLSWDNAQWTDFFIDIEGNKKPSPYFDTRVKMLWDNEFIYFFAELEEQHIWGNITKRDAVIYHNNDFEIFIKPNQFEPYYAEWEVNALGTLWELFLARPYRRNGPVLNHWDINGTKIAIQFQGTLNDPTDIDTAWFIEMAIPIQPIKDIDRGSEVKEGTMWRINFSRVQWEHQIEDGVYSRKLDRSGNRVPEYNWVWTEQSAIAMHRPEHWGYLFFSEEDALSEPIGYADKLLVEQQLLFFLYRKQLEFNSENNVYADTISAFGGPDFLVNSLPLTASVTTTNLGFEITVSNPSKNSITINQDGYIKTHQ